MSHKPRVPYEDRRNAKRIRDELRRYQREQIMDRAEVAREKGRKVAESRRSE